MVVELTGLEVSDEGLIVLEQKFCDILCSTVTNASVSQIHAMTNLLNPETFEAILNIATVIVAIRLVFSFLKSINRFVPWQAWTFYVLVSCLIYIHANYIEPEPIAKLASILVLISAHLFADIPNRSVFGKTTDRNKEELRDVKLGTEEIRK